MIAVFDFYTNHQYFTAAGFKDGGIDLGNGHYVTQASNAYGDFHFDAVGVGAWEKASVTGAKAGTVTLSHDGMKAQVYGYATLP